MDILSIREKQKPLRRYQRSRVLFYAMQQKSPRNSEALSYGCIYPFWKLTRILSYFFGHVNSFSFLDV